MLSHSMTSSSDRRRLSMNASLPCNIFPHSILVRRRRHATFDRGWYGVPEQKLRVGSDTARRASVCRRWVRQSFVVYLTHLWRMRRVGKSGVMGLHGYWRGRDIVRGSVCSRRSVFAMTTGSASPWRWLDHDDPLLFFPRTETAKSDQSMDEDDASQE